jgi:L-alanine-DL-glutamate epimerase-like enolase superfamily enzyme
MTADLTIAGYESRALRVPERPVGDSQTHVFETDAFEYLYLELDTDAGVTGVGVDLIELRAPGRPSVETLRSRVDAVVGDAVGESAFSLLNRRRRHRGGVYNYYESGSYGPGVGVTLDMALWDACAKHVDQPLYAFMGGLDRLMIDPNEAWSPSETLRRLRIFREAGFDVFWVEDPVFRHDLDGMGRVVENTPETHVTVGEYLGFEEKRSLLDAGACDVLNLQGLTAARQAATLAQSTGTPVAISTDHATDATSVHAGLSLPDVVAVECCYHRLFELAAEPPYAIEDGEVVPADRPGHGVAFDDDVLAEYER